MFLSDERVCCFARSYGYEVIRNMKTKAAIAYTASKPLEVMTVDLGRPKGGEALVEIKWNGWNSD